MRVVAFTRGLLLIGLSLVLASASAREQKEAAVRARLARGELGLDLYEMRETLAAKGLTYRDAKDS
jgi:4-hydroxy-4-methyl-2-oxoglutarate aldolase